MRDQLVLFNATKLELRILVEMFTILEHKGINADAITKQGLS